MRYAKPTEQLLHDEAERLWSREAAKHDVLSQPERVLEVIRTAARAVQDATAGKAVHA